MQNSNLMAEHGSIDLAAAGKLSVSTDAIENASDAFSASETPEGEVTTTTGNPSCKKEALESSENKMNGYTPINGDSGEVSDHDFQSDTKILSEKEGGEKLKIFSSTELKNAGYKFGYISTNRKPTDLNVDKKVASFKKSNGLITPCLIVNAEDCIAQRLKVVSEEGTSISDPEDIRKTLVVIDGQHRHLAVLKYNETIAKKEGMAKLDCYYHFPLTKGVDIVSMLREANVATVPWKGGDYLTNLVSMNHDSEIDMAKIYWIKSHLGSCGDSAAWIWANFKDKIYSKSDMIKASKDPKLLKEMANPNNFEFGKELYEAVVDKLGQSIAKLKITPLTLVSIYDVETKSECGNAVITNLKNFINSITSDEVEKIQKIKKMIDSKGNTVTKDIQIETTLRDLWESYKKRKEGENE